MWTKAVGGSAVALLCAAGATFSSSRWPPSTPLSSLPLVSAATSDGGKGSLAGCWCNDLGSKMVLEPPDANGFFRGTYRTRVSTKKPIKISPLSGMQNITGGKEEEQPTFGFTVGWTFTDSTAVFVGQRFVDVDGEEALKTVWLLRQKAKDSKDDWKATRVGNNIFKRIDCASETAQFHSHPTPFEAPERG